MHDPAVSGETKQANSERGAAASARVRRWPSAVNPTLRTMDAIQAYIEDTAGALDRGEINERGSNARARLADAATRAHEANLGQRLTELEQLVRDRRGLVHLRYGGARESR